MMSAKIANPDLLKIKVFWNICYDVITFTLDVANKILSSNSNYSVDVVMWPKFGNSRPGKTLFLRVGPGSSSRIAGWD